MNNNLAEDLDEEIEIIQWNPDMTGPSIYWD